MNLKKAPAITMAGLLTLHILAQVDRNMLLGFSPDITKALSLTNAQYGLLAGAVWVISFGVMAPVLGALGDRYSRTRIMALGILVWSVCTAASGLANSFGALVAARFFVASGEAALVPAAVSLIAELFSEKRRGTAMGIFFMGIPAGVGLSFVLAGTLGNALGWRHTFFTLGALGVSLALPLLFVKDIRTVKPVNSTQSSDGKPGVLNQLSAITNLIKGTPVLKFTMIGFVMVHFVFIGMAFVQLWMVRELGMNGAQIARTLGGVQIVFGILGSVVGGVLSDRIIHKIPGERAGFCALLIALCTPLMIMYRFAQPDTALFYLGMAAASFLPMATYGPSIAIIQGNSPENLRSTVTGVSMMLINVFAVALGNAAAGWFSDRLTVAGFQKPLMMTLLVTDVLTLMSGVLYAMAAFSKRQR